MSEGQAHLHTNVLAAVATALATADEVTSVAETLISVLCPAFADGCEVALRTQDHGIVRVASGPGDLTARARAPVPSGDWHPLRRAMDGEFLVIDADDDPQQRLFGPAADRTSARGLGLRSAVVAPMRSGDAVIGALAVARATPGSRFSPDDQALVRVVAQLTAHTIDNLQSADQLHRIAARLRTASAIGVAFSNAVHAEDIAAMLVDRGGQELNAISGLVYLCEPDGHLRLVSYFGHPPDRVERWERVPPDPSTPLGQVIVGSSPSIWLESLADVLARYPVVGPVDGSEHRSLAAVRLSHGAEIVGAAFWTFEVGRRFNDADRGLIELLAEQAGGAISRARATAEAARHLEQRLEIEQRQRVIARTLQASLLPHALPEIDGVELHAVHWPASADMDVGGDFYDVFPLDDAEWGLVIGDVCGKGAAAAAVTAAARHSLRAAAMHIPDEARVIAWVHDAIAAQPSAPFCTVAFAVLDLTADPLMRVVLAGHDKGIRVAANGTVSELGEYGTLLGVERPDVTVAQVGLTPGDLVVFFTDGVTDAPGSEALLRPELIELLCEHRSEPLPAIAGAIRAALDRRRPNGDRDDTALLMLRMGPSSTADD
jgi:serine phosphatase RsbU (regulator of sigma subunit)